MAEEHWGRYGEGASQPASPPFRPANVEQQRTRTLVDRVAGISGIAVEEVPQATVGVLDVLQRHLSGGVARRLESQLPLGVRDWMKDSTKPTEAGAETFDRSTFFRWVEEALHLEGRRVGPVVQGVFAAVREQVSEDMARDVANQLPEGLKQLWDHPVPDVRAPDIQGVEHRQRRPVTDALRAKRSESRQTNTYLRFLREVSAKGDLTLDEAEDAAASVLCLLDQRLTQAEAGDLNAQLPMKLRELLVRCARHPGAPLRFDLAGLYEMVGEDLNMDPSETPPVVAAVLAVVKAQISAGEARDVASQLPRDIAAEWERA